MGVAYIIALCACYMRRTEGAMQHGGVMCKLCLVFKGVILKWLVTGINKGYWMVGGRGSCNWIQGPAELVDV